jgi:hypothetical protein
VLPHFVCVLPDGGMADWVVCMWEVWVTDFCYISYFTAKTQVSFFVTIKKYLAFSKYLLATQADKYEK